MSNTLSLLLFLVLALGGGLAIGYVTAPGEWYAALAKPWFTPPGWLFAPVWTVLYALIAVTGWRTWRRAPAGRAMRFWWLQLGLNFLWSPAFFAARQIELALVVILLLLAAILGFMAAARRDDPLAPWLFAPYAAWVAFATALNGSIAGLN